MKALILAISTSLALASGSSAHADRTSFLDIFADSNRLECVELNFDGVATFVEVKWTGITFYGSPIISHYTPDFLVTAYSRLGDSPLLESYAAFGSAQNWVSKPIVEFLNGADAPETYGVKGEWGSGKGTDASDRHKKTLSFYEAEVFGHPGNVFSWASKGFRGETIFNVNTATNFVTAIPEQAMEVPGRAQAQFQEAQANSGTTLGEGFSLDALSKIDPIELVTNFFVGELGNMYEESGIGQAIDDVRASIPDSVEEDIVGTVIDFGGGLLSNATSEAAENSGGAGSAEVDTEGGLLPDFDLASLEDDVLGELQESLGMLSPEAIRAELTSQIEALTDKVAGVQQLFVTLQSLADPALLTAMIPGVSATILPFNGFCPSDVEPFQPYFLSGTNILSWRFNIPEVVYPQTYIPFSNSTTVGTLLPGGSLNPLANNPLSTLAEIQNYGSVYPRAGFMLQSHPVKAAALAAFRASHIVTRPGQPHLYDHPSPTNHERFLQLDAGYDDVSFSDDDRLSEKTYLEPDIEETGRWQLNHNVGGEKDKSCRRFGAPEDNQKMTAGNPIKMIGETANTFTNQWADDKSSTDNNYIFSLWRRYRCAPEPQERGGWFSSKVFHMGNILFPSPIKVLHSGI